MNFKILITALALGLALPAMAQFEVTSRAYEVALKDFARPQMKMVVSSFALARSVNSSDFALRLTRSTR